VRGMIRPLTARIVAAPISIDGEAVWCDGEGVAIFDRLDSRAYDGEVSLYAFDLLELDGTDWKPRPMRSGSTGSPSFLPTPRPGSSTASTSGEGAAIFAHACRLGAEGSTASTRTGPGRSANESGPGQSCCLGGSVKWRGAPRLSTFGLAETYILTPV
jgi:bifunctional non-homologous end joining protein LigD